MHENVTNPFASRTSHLVLSRPENYKSGSYSDIILKYEYFGVLIILEHRIFMV